jgi:cation diffusion facilitator CzcD-associated flavoprotein CzcO
MTTNTSLRHAVWLLFAITIFQHISQWQKKRCSISSSWGRVSVAQWQCSSIANKSGPTGLAMGKTYLQAHPECRMLIIDSSSTVGGTWAANRLFPGLKTNNMEGGYEFGDFPMRGESRYGLKPDQFIPGTIMNQYMMDYADHFGLTERTRLKSRAHHVERLNEGTWRITSNEQGTDHTFHTYKLVFATGLTNRPFIPFINGQNDFNGPIVHASDSWIYRGVPKGTKDVVVLNVSKSGCDAAYALAMQGVKVHWIIREAGHGPCWMSAGRVTPLKQRIEDLAATRLFSWFSPCVWGKEYLWISWFLQQTWLGKKITTTLWKTIHDDMVSCAGYQDHPETAKMQPRGDAVFYGCTLGIWNYDTDLRELVRNGSIQIYLDDIDHLSNKQVHLASGTALPADAVVTSTGWQHVPSIKLSPPGLAAELGMPVPDESPITQEMAAKADAEILSDLPWLAENMPSTHLGTKPLPVADPSSPEVREDKSTQAYRMYRFVAPPTHVGPHNPHPTVAFIGNVWAISTVIVAVTSALWITAYFDGKLPQQQPLKVAPGSTLAKAEQEHQARILHETALHTEFPKLRYPHGFGIRFPDMVFDSIPFADVLMHDLGLPAKRKKGSWLVRLFKETFEAYSSRDYPDLVSEWQAVQVRKQSASQQGAASSFNGHAKAA